MTVPQTWRVATTTTGELGARHISADEAVEPVRPGDHVFVGSACGTPRSLVEALERRDPPPEGVVLVHSLTHRVGVGDPLQTAYRHRVFYADLGAGRGLRGRRAQDVRARSATRSRFPPGAR